MKKNLNLAEILKDCEGITLYSVIHGECKLVHIDVNTSSNYKIRVESKCGSSLLTDKGLYDEDCDGECILFPSKEQRDWDKFAKPVKDYVPKVGEWVWVSDNTNRNVAWDCRKFIGFEQSLTKAQSVGKYICYKRIPSEKTSNWIYARPLNEPPFI